MVSRLLQLVIRLISLASLGLAVVLVAGLYLVQLPSIQTRLAHEATRWLSEKLGGPVQIDRVKVRWFDDISLEGVHIQDLKNRPMIDVAEIFINFQTNFQFDRVHLIRFDNNLDYVMLRQPNVKLIREADGNFNFDRWIAKIQRLVYPNPDPSAPEHNIPFTIDEAYIQDGQLSLTDPRKARFPKEEFDYRNFALHDITGQINQFFIQGDTITFQGERIKARDYRSDLQLKSLDTDFFYSRQHLKLRKLEAHINDSYIRNAIELTYREPVDFDDFNHLVWIDAQLDGCDIQAQDLARFAPGLYAYQDRYLMSGQFSGTVDQFVVNNFALSFGQQSYTRGTLQWEGLPDYTTARMKFDLLPSRWIAADVAQYAGPQTYEEHVKEFGQVDFQGKFAGTYRDFVTDFDIASSGLGQAKGSLAVALGDQPEKSTYSGKLNIQRLALGQLAKQEDILGKISFTGEIKGEGLTLPSASVYLDGTVHQIEFNGYNYQHLDVNGQLGKSIFEGDIRIQDPHLVADLHGEVDFNPAFNVFNIEGFLDYAHLGELGLTQSPIRLKTNLDLKMTGNSIDDWLGSISLRETILRENEDYFRFDTLDLQSSTVGELRKFALQSEFFTIQLAGKYKPIAFIQATETAFTDFLGLWTAISVPAAPTPFSLTNYTAPSQADFSIRFKKAQSFLDYFAPGVYMSPGTHFTGTLAVGATYALQLIGTADTLRVGDHVFKTNSLQTSFQKTVGVPGIQANLEAHSYKQNIGQGLLQTDRLDLFGQWQGTNPIQMEAYVQQVKSTNKLQLFGQLSVRPDLYEIALQADESYLDLLNQRWRLPTNNRIIASPGRVQFERIALIGVDQRVSLDGEINKLPGRSARLSLENFDLRALQPLIQENITGIANGNLSLLNAYDSPQILSNFQINQLTHEGFLVGNVVANSRYDTQVNKVLLSLELEKQNQKILSVNGTYDSNDAQSPLDLNASLREGDMAIFQPFVRDIFSQLQGQMNGFVQIQGRLNRPSLTGRVNIQQGHLKLDALQTDFYFTDEVVLKPSGFFTKETGFQVFDAPQKGNVGLVTGGVEYDDEGKFRLNLHGVMQDREGFRLMKTTSKDNPDFYGLAHATGDIHLTGPLEDVLITGNLTSKRGTKLVIPLDGETSVNVEEEAIPFLDKQGRTVNQVLTNQPIDSTTTSQATNQLIDLNGLKMALNLTLTPDAECEIIFDRANNDRVVAFGDARLTVDYDTRGGFSLTGPYVVRSGKYDFSFQNLASLRKFEITEGSKISWSGDPYEAVIDMDAVYSANVSLAEVPGIPTNTSEALNRYPVKVKVHLRDQLMVPTVTFSIDFDERQIPVNFQSQTLAFEQRLRDDEQLLSRNVSSIMAFNQIFPSNIVDALRQQFLIDNLNNMLSNQIGNLANKLDPNLELGLQLGDVRQNFNNAQLNVSYKLLNDRVRLSGRSAYMNGAVDGLNPQGLLTVGGEIDYMLTTDGTWRMKAYSRSMPNANFFLAGNAGGNVLVYGVSLQFSQNFNRLIPRKTFPLGTQTTDTEPRP